LNNEALQLEDDPTLPPHRPVLAVFFGADGLRAGWSLLLYIAIFAALLSFAHFVLPLLHHPPTHKGSGPHEQSPTSAFLGESSAFLAIALATWIMSLIEKRPLGVYGLGGARRIPHFLAGLGWGVAFLSLLVFILKTAGLLVFDSRLLFGGNILRDGAIWLAGFLLVALMEENLLRGYLQFTLSRGLTGIYSLLGSHNRRALGFWTAAILLSFLFGLGHGSNSGESPIGLLSAGLAGVVFCLSLWRTGSLWWAIGFHASWDWAQSFLYGVADSGTMVQFHLFATHPTGRPLISGGATGPEGSIFVVPILALVAVIILVTLPKQDPAEVLPA
jgi:membrane protease YdiL (CAAX protease family)